MNDTLNGTMDDRQVIARLRAALDEVASVEIAASGGSSTSFREPSGGSPRRWLAVAAASVVLIAGAVWTLSRRSPDGGRPEPVATGAAPVTSGSPAMTQAPPTTSVVQVPADWYVLGAEGLEPGGVRHEPCCADLPEPDPVWTVAWRIDTGTPAFGLLVLEALPGDGTLDPEHVTDVPADATVLVQPDGARWWFRSNGMSAEERERLAGEVVLGSGIPFVLPDPAATLLAVGFEDMGEHTAQEYVGDGGAIVLSVGRYRGHFAAMIAPSIVEPVTVAGSDGFTASTDEGTVVIWRAAGDQWAVLEIPVGYAGDVDRLVASIVPAPLPG